MDLTRQWLDQRFRQVRPARPASAVVLVREGPEGPEVLLRHRAGQTPLGRIGFPGGSLIATDTQECRWFGPAPAAWSASLGIVDRRRARQHVVAAARELFEEAGVLLAGRSEGEIVADARGTTWGDAGSSLEHPDLGLPALLGARGLGLRADLLRPIERWSSAPHAHRRFDTVVFAAAVPAQEAAGQDVDVPAAPGWFPARRLLAEPMALPGPAGWMGEAGVVRLDQVATPMTQVLLRRVAAHRTAAAFLLSLASAACCRGPVAQRRLVTEADETDRLWMRVEDAARPC